jgi:MFS family permease
MILPAGVAPEARLLLVGRALRSFCDGFVAILLPAYLLALGLGNWEVGVISTATLLGSALMTLALGHWGHRMPIRRLLPAAALLMTATGLLLAGFSDFWPLLLVAFFGTINPSSGDVSVFLPLEQARLSDAAQGDARTVLFSRYTFIGALCAACGALAAALPVGMGALGIAPLDALRLMFVFYGLTGAAIFLLYRRLPAVPAHEQAAPAPLGPSRGTVIRLAALLSQMDVPTRTAFVMAVVTPPERAAAASFTAVPRSLAAAASPALGGALFAAGWLAAPLVACGLLKIAYDLAIWRAFRSVRPEN